MDALETLVREALAEHAHEAPAPDRLLAGPRSAERGARRLPYALVAAAGVVAVAVGVLVLRGSGSHSAPPAGPSFAPIPSGRNAVSYHGITIQVPSLLSVRYDSCALGRNTVRVFDPDSGPFCPLGRVAAHTGILITLDPTTGHAADRDTLALARSPITIDGKPAMTGYGTATRRSGVTGVLVLADPGVAIAVSTPSRAQARAILHTVHVTPLDRNGCASTQPGLANAAAPALLPGRPTGAVLCSYTRDSSTSEAPWLVSSTRLPIATVDRVVHTIDALPAGPVGPEALPTGPGGRDDGYAPPQDRLIFSYPDGGTHTVSVDRSVYPADVTDGRYLAHDEQDEIEALLPGVR